MKNLERAKLELTDSQLLNIKNQIKNWSTKDQVLDIMKYQYGRSQNKAA